MPDRERSITICTTCDGPSVNSILGMILEKKHPDLVAHGMVHRADCPNKTEAAEAKQVRENYENAFGSLKRAKKLVSKIDAFLEEHDPQHGPRRLPNKTEEDQA